MTGQCDLLNPGGSGCPGAPVASVVLNLTDAAGMAIPAATIAFTVNGGLSYGGSCNGDCNSVLLAQDVVGRLDIQVAAVGFVTATKSVDVVAEQGGCHPVTQFVTIKMDKDTTVGVLFGVWSTQTFAGRNVLRSARTGRSWARLLQPARAATAIGASHTTITPSGDGRSARYTGGRG
jgi:hypothetical protein